jgi:hypothetical protein
MRSNKDAEGFQRIYRSESGGSQGNTLAGINFALLIKGPLKKFSASHNGIVVRAITTISYSAVPQRESLAKTVVKELFRRCSTISPDSTSCPTTQNFKDSVLMTLPAVKFRVGSSNRKYLK